MSNPRKPKAQKIIEGTFRKDREPTPIPDNVEHIKKIPRPPEYLTATAKAYWKKISKILIDRNVLTDGDLMGLEILCNSYAMYLECFQVIRKVGLKNYVEERNSQTALALTTLNKLSTAIKTWCGVFGLSPSDRAKMAIPEGKDEADPMEAFFKTN